MQKNYLSKTSEYATSQHYKVMSTIVDDYLPDQREKFIVANVFQSGRYRRYKDVPYYLQNLPKAFILHCKERRYGVSLS